MLFSYLLSCIQTDVISCSNFKCVHASTYFGRETEMSAFTWFDGHGVEFDQNHWMLVLHTPGSDVLDVPPPAEGMTECPQICQNTCIDASDADLAKTPASNDQATGR